MSTIISVDIDVSEYVDEIPNNLILEACLHRAKKDPNFSEKLINVFFQSQSQKTTNEEVVLAICSNLNLNLIQQDKLRKCLNNILQ